MSKKNLTATPSSAHKPLVAKGAPTHHLDLDGLDDALGGFDMLSVAKGGGTLEALRSQAAVPAGEPLQLPIDRVLEDPNQPRRRFDPEAQKELEDSVRQIGIKSPLSVRSAAADGTYLLNFGARRLRAARAAGLATVPAFIDDNHDEFAQVVENEQRDNLTTMDLARFVGEKIEAGFSQVDIASRLSKSKTWVAKYAALNKIPGWLAHAAEAGKIESVDALYDLASYVKKNPEGEGDARVLCETEKVSFSAVRGFLSQRKSEAATPTTPTPSVPPHAASAASAGPASLSTVVPKTPENEPDVGVGLPGVSGPKLSPPPLKTETRTQGGGAGDSEALFGEGSGLGVLETRQLKRSDEDGGEGAQIDSDPFDATAASHQPKNEKPSGPLPVLRFSNQSSEAAIVSAIQAQRSKLVTRFIVEILER
jgi:ParB family chromosome partitioning protein